MNALAESATLKTLRELEVQGFRCFDRLNIAFKPGINLIHGANGCGKTTLIEALDILSRRRTFRAGYLKPIIRRGASNMRVVAHFSAPFNASFNQGARITIEKQRGRALVATIGQEKALRKDQARQFPLRIVHSAGSRTINGPAKSARQALDWGVFHVEQAFFEVWNRYCRTLIQRNALLRRRAPRNKTKQWDSVLSSLAEQLDAMREKYATRLIERVNAITRDVWKETPCPQAVYERGWQPNVDLATVLRDEYSDDLRRGYTRHGAHRARLRWFYAGQDDFSPSGGQLKMLVAAQAIGQSLLQEEDERPCVLAIDDFTSELDETNQQILIEWLSAIKGTIVVTSLDEKPLASICATTLRLEKPQPPENRKKPRRTDGV